MFFITGLPRSRTAWFSAFMTASGYPCLHEGINGCKSIKEYKDKIKDISDSNTAFGFVDIPFSGRPILVIHRGKETSNRLDEIKGLHVDFDDINERISEIFTYLTGNDIDMKLFNLFKDLNIQTMATMDIDSAKVLLNG